jgi:hypothetical protein
MVDEDFPYTVLEDDDVIAKFKRIEDASSFAANHEWQDAPFTVVGCMTEGSTLT